MSLLVGYPEFPFPDRYPFDHTSKHITRATTPRPPRFPSWTFTLLVLVSFILALYS